jgi:P pilus assembly chaperone PapD
MTTAACETCGEQNPPGTQFCLRCNSFLAWEEPAPVTRTPAPVTRAPAPRPPEELIETRVMPKVRPAEPVAPPAVRSAPDPHPGPAATTAPGTAPTPRTPPVAAPPPEPVLRIEPPTAPLVVPVDGSTVELSLTIRNLSDIVDGYAVDVGGAPPWLVVVSDQLRLLPDTEDRLMVRFRVDSVTLVPAGELNVRLRVRSMTRPPAHEIVAVTLSVPVVDAPVSVRIEPSIARAKDVDITRLSVVVDNAAANRPATVRLAGSDPELAVAFHFDPAEITVGPGESARARLVTTSARPEPGRETTRSLTVSATEGRRRVDATALLVQSTSLVVEDPMVELTATPSLVRLRDDDSTVVRLTVSNRAGRQWATVRLDAADPERLVHAGWSASEVRVPPGGSTDVDVRLTCPAIEPGTEVMREVALVASDGARTARTPVTLRQSASVSPMTTLAVRLDPSVVRLSNRRRGSSAVIVDNGQGRAPIRVWLRGDDPENALAFTFTPAQLEIPAGQSASTRMTFSGPRAPGGREITRSFTVAATDGRSAATTSGSIIQSASDRRPWARVLLTIGGAAAILLGVMLPFAGSVVPALGLDDGAVEQALQQRNLQVELGDLPGLLSVGFVLVVLAGLMAFGLTGASGRLTRWTALFAAVVLVASAVMFRDFGLGPGVVVIGLGCVLGYIGGLLRRR